MSGYSFGLGGPSWNGLPMLGGEGFPFTTGNFFYVNSNIGSDGNNGKSSKKPFATLNYAIGKCTNNKGDTILVMPNHAETITGVGGITVDIAGINIIGLGTYNSRPRFLMDGATSVTALVTAANVTIKNIVFASGHLLVATCFGVTAPGFTLDTCSFKDNTTAENFGNIVRATGAANTADGLRIINCRWLPLVGTVNSLAFISITDNICDLTVRGNFVIHEGTDSPFILQAGTKVMTRVEITWNFLSHKMTAGTLFLSNGGTGNSGIIAHNRFGHADVTTTHNWGAATGFRLFDNLSTSVGNLSGFVLPAIDVDS